MLSEPADGRHELFGAWCAPIFSVLTVVGFLGFAGFYAPAAASLPPSRLAAYYAEHRFGVELGMSIFCVATAFLAIFTVALTLALLRIERGSPLMAVSQALGGLGVVLLIFISCCLWIGAAYRAGAAAPDVTVALNDAAWFGFLVGWVMLSLQMAVTAAVTLRDRSAAPLVPRWLSWASVIGAVVLVTANGCVFTKTGTFAWDGVLGYYLPMAIWATWLDGHAWYLRKRLRRPRTEPAATALANV
ncbi:MAG TPA: hypothetical protein VH008_27640 [Pseudonocardia sp.]|jgi:hypothetical protein|nr:hypothetical protein [Pseudonocardia sp.]